MTAARATFTGFDPYMLTRVTVTDKELGHGSYATVLELEYMGLKCAGKEIHDLLLRQGDDSYTVRRFEEECHLLSQVRHPNIVQFLGVYFQQGVQAPILVMEFLPTNLTSCIDQHSILPKEIGYSILHDVALGLCYLHSQTPSIIHRDLSSNNVLLTTSNMTAKISDLGVARILNLTPLQVSRMTQTPGTPAYMPPEVMVANPKYDTSVDEFSYGVLMIHVFCGKWPEPQVGPSRTELDGRLIPVTEAERREVFLQAIGNDNPLMDLICKCIHNHPQARAHASEFVERLAAMVLEFPVSLTSQMEMLRQIETIEEEKRALTEEGEEKNMVIQQKESQISLLKEEIQVKEQQQTTERAQLNFAHSSEVEQLRLQIQNLNTQNQLVLCMKDAELEELRSHAALDVSQIENNSKSLKLEKEMNKRLRADIEDLQSNLSKSQSENIILQNSISELQASIVEKDNVIQTKDASAKRNDSDLKAMSRALEEKDATISALSEQLTKASEYLAIKKQTLQASIAWKKCAQLPTTINQGKAVIINDKVYCGAGWSGFSNDPSHYAVYCYTPSQDKWTTLPSLPVRYFGLGQVNGRLVAVGGMNKSRVSAQNEVYTYDGRSQKWRQSISPMPTARWCPSVLSLQSALIVAGGGTLSSYRDAVEVYKPDRSYWYRTDPLLTACRDVSLVALDNICYVLGGYNGSCLNQALYASLDDLDKPIPIKIVCANTESTSVDSHQPAWKPLPDTPTNGPTVAVLAGHLLAIGGEDTFRERSVKEIHMYSSSTNSWIYIGDLPAPRCSTAVAVLSPTEILMIGGCSWSEKQQLDQRVNTVCKGTLHLNL